MAKNVSLWGASYTDVPAVQIPQTGGGTATFYDINVVDNLNSTSATDALSANQGRVLDEKIQIVKYYHATKTFSAGKGMNTFQTSTPSGYRILCAYLSNIPNGDWIYAAIGTVASSYTTISYNNTYPDALSGDAGICVVYEKITS